MSNRFYIQPEVSPGIKTGLGVADLALRFTDLKERSEAERKRLELAKQQESRQKKESEADYGPGGFKSRELGVRERLATVAESDDARKARGRVTKWEQFMEEAPDAVSIALIGEKIPEFAPIVRRVLGGIKEGNIKSRWDAYRNLKESSAVETRNASDKLLRRIGKLHEEGKYDEANQLGNLYNAMQSPTFVEDFFDFPKEYREGGSAFKDFSAGSPYAGISMIRGYDEEGNPMVVSTSKGTSGQVPGMKSFEKPQTEKPADKLRMDLSISELQAQIEENKTDEALITRQIPIFNSNSKDVVAYHYKKEKKWGSDANEARFLPLPTEAIQAGWTPLVIQTVAKQKGITIQDLLTQIGLIE